MSRNRAAGLFVFSTLLLFAVPAVAGVDDQIYTNKDVVAGRTIGEWSGAWWQWAWAIPDSVHPLLDSSGFYASQGQSGPVFFIGGSFVPGTYQRTITVPEGKALFFPLLNSSIDNYICGTFVPKLTINEMRKLAEAGQNSPQRLILEIDGKAVGNLDRFRVTSPVYSVFLGEGALCTPTASIFIGTTPPGEYMQQVSDGYYVMVKPFSRGRHTIRLGGTSADGSFTLDVTYYITVE